MEYPYSWECLYSRKPQGPFSYCECTIYPLFLLISINNEKKVLPIQMTRIPYMKNATQLQLCLEQGKQLYFFKLSNQVDLKIVRRIFQLAYPVGDFEDYYENEETVASLTNQNCEVKVCQHKIKKNKYLVRSLNLSKKNALQELEIVRTLNHRAVLKPIEIYNQDHLLKMVYQYAQGNNLKRILRKKLIYQQHELSQFIKKMLSLKVHLKQKNIFLAEFTESSIILVNQNITEPYIFDFSEAELRKPDSKKTKQKRLRFSLAKIFYKLVFAKNHSLECNQQIEQFLQSPKTTAEGPYNAYRKSMFKFMHTMLTNTTLKAEQLLRDIWFKEATNIGSKNLTTIVSLNEVQERTNQFLDCSESTIEGSDEPELYKWMKEYNNSGLLKKPQSF